MSLQMGFAYIANITISPFFGIVGENTTFLILPYVILGIVVISVLCNEMVLQRTKKLRINN